MNLVIVESPTKSNTIKGYLGSGYKVVASKGHVRDLPKSSLGIDVENGFEPHYINIRGRGDLIRDLKKEVKKADKVFLAPDPDREGEAISWHLVSALDIPEEKIRRITFNEVTKTAVKDAIKHPREIDMDLVNAQQARRILDRLVGYKLSPLLWKNVKSGLSAGRVQSVVARMIVEREEEIRAFVPKEYWTLDAVLSANGTELTVHYYGDAADGKKKELSSKEDCDGILSDIGEKEFKVTEIKKATKQRAPAPPFTTSTLQQEASRRLNFQTHRTMKVAQELYEGIDLGAENGGVQGLITYMRTDSLRIATEAQTAAREFITERYGEKYYPSKPRVFKSKNNAQDAHEAIRPANVRLEPSAVKKHLTADQYRLYKLIWDRFVASQMQSAQIATETCDFTVSGALFRAVGNTVRFPGFMSVYEEATDEPKKNEDKSRLPSLNEGQMLECLKTLPEQHFTEPPARYSEASLIKVLEEKGIGRPSTYNTILSIVLSRGYVNREGKSLVPTPLVETITKLLKGYFPDIVDCAYTAQMEKELDGIESGDATMLDVLTRFYSGFSEELASAEKSISPDEFRPPVEETDIVCELCGAKMVVKTGRFGKFAACPNYPKCKNTKTLDSDKKQEDKEEETSQVTTAPFKCENCGSDMILRHGRYGDFWACVQYPKCRFTKPIEVKTGVTCPKCGGDILVRSARGRKEFFSCSNYPKCDFSTWDRPLDKKCPDCGELLYYRKTKNQAVCKNCRYKTDLTPEEIPGGDDR